MVNRLNGSFYGLARKVRRVAEKSIGPNQKWAVGECKRTGGECCACMRLHKSKGVVICRKEMVICRKERLLAYLVHMGLIRLVDEKKGGEGLFFAWSPKYHPIFSLMYDDLWLGD